jgi:hypothetical protein
MAMREPIEPIGLPVHLEAEAEADSQLFLELEQYLPTDTLTQGVRNFLQNIDLSTVEHALGRPELMKGLLDLIIQEENPRSGSDFAKLSSELRTHYQEFALKLGGQISEVPSQRVEEEVETAKHELIRHCVDLIHSAGTMWGFPVNLDPLFKPKVPSQEYVKPWSDILVDRRDALYAALALSKEDMQKISQQVADSLRVKLRGNRTLHLPLGMQIALGPEKEFLVTKRSAERQSVDDKIQPSPASKPRRGVLGVLRRLLS